MAESEIAYIEKKRKRQFTYFCLAICIPTLVAFTILDIIEGESLEVLSNVLMLFTLIAGLIGIKKMDADRLSYRLVLVLMAFFSLYNIAIGAGEGTAAYWIFPFPLVFMYLLGKKEGSMFNTVFFFILLILLINPFSLAIYQYDVGISFRFLISLILVTLMAYGLEASREKYGHMLINKNRKLQQEKLHLENALGEIKTLSGLIPICSKCKKVRNDNGYWEQVESYVKERSLADFSHGICPDCF